MACTFLYQTGIQIYDRISSLRIWSKVKLRHSISLRFVLKEEKRALINWKQVQPFRASFHQVFLNSKIARNPLKVCMHGYLSNGYLNSSSNFSYKKAEKITSLRPLLEKPWITTKIGPNIMKFSMHSYLPNALINKRLNFNFEKLVNVKLRCAVLLRLGLRGWKYFGMSQKFACMLVHQMGIQIYDQI